MTKVEKRERIDEIERSIDFHKFVISRAVKDEDCDYQWHSRQIYDLLKMKQLHIIYN